jgi:hypothetical protein
MNPLEIIIIILLVFCMVEILVFVVDFLPTWINYNNSIRKYYSDCYQIDTIIKVR